MSILDRLAGLVLRWVEQNVQLADSPDQIVVKTTRYLGLGLLGLVVGLGASVLYEQAQTHPSCWQESISAYYYTPVQSFFVAALVSIGIGMIVLKGNTEWEDVLLNGAADRRAVVLRAAHQPASDCAPDDAGQPGMTAMQSISTAASNASPVQPLVTRAGGSSPSTLR